MTRVCVCVCVCVCLLTAGLQGRSRLALQFKAGRPVTRVVWSFGFGPRPPAAAAAADAAAVEEALLVVRHDDRTFTREFAALTATAYGQPLPTPPVDHDAGPERS